MKAYNFLITLIVFGLISSCSGNQQNEPEEKTPTDSTQPTVLQPITNAIPLVVNGTKPLTEKNRIIYEMDLLSFTSQGTINAAQNRLKELSDLGIDIIWLMPIHERGNDKFATYPSPYAPKDYYSVWSKYGTKDDLKSFVQNAHTLGMEVWLDWVPNHTGTGAVWVTEHPEYYVWNGSNIKHPNDYSDVLQLAMKETATQEAMIQAMEYWIDEADIDGFRCDYVSSPEIPADFWKKAIPELKNHKTGKTITIMGEADFADQSRLYDCGFDFDYAWRLNTTLRQQGKATNAATLKNSIAALYSNSHYKNGLDKMVYLTNHDDNSEGKNYWQWMTDNIYLFTVVEFTSFGMPLIYNGQEVGHKNIIYPWEKNNINWKSPNKKMQNTIATLCALKHTQVALQNGSESERGTYRALTTDNQSVYAYCRQKDSNSVVVLLNMGDSTIVTIKGIEQGQYTQWLDSKTITEGASQRKWQLTDSCALKMEKKGYMIFVK